MYALRGGGRREKVGERNAKRRKRVKWGGRQRGGREKTGKGQGSPIPKLKQNSDARIRA